LYLRRVGRDVWFRQIMQPHRDMIPVATRLPKEPTPPQNPPLKRLRVEISEVRVLPQAQNLAAP
jgi:hypothetical protein